MPLPNMTPARLLAGAQEVARRFPGAELVKNQVGNLAIVAGGRYCGSIDLRTGEVDVLGPEEIEAFAGYDGTQAGRMTDQGKPGDLARFEARDAAELARDAPPHEFDPREGQPHKCGFGWGGDGMFCGYLAEDHDRARAAGWGAGQAARA